MFFGKKFSGYRKKGQLSGLDVLVLSIIKNNEAISGYEIIQKINKKFKDLWTASAGTIYPLLNKLAEKDFVEIKEVVESGREKKLYTIKEQGNEALKNVLLENLEPSVHTLGDYIRTVIKAVPFQSKMNETFCCHSFDDFFLERQLDEDDVSRENIERIKSRINKLEKARESLNKRISDLDKTIDHYNKVLNKIEKIREEESVIIEISDDDEDFENF